MLSIFSGEVQNLNVNGGGDDFGERLRIPVEGDQ
jgi:hypothetical protein